jgi:hypothetical protein
MTLRSGTVAYSVLFLCLALPAFSLGRRAGSGPASPSAPDAALPSAPSVPGPNGTPVRGGDWVELEGRIRLVGAEPFTDLVLTDGAGQDWYLEGPGTLRSFEQRTVKIRGRVKLREMVLANGRRQGLRRSLSDLKLLE